MNILEVKSLLIPEVKIIKFKRFCDSRGYFTETMNIPEIKSNEKCDFLKEVDFLQVNEAHSKANTIRGLHFQWAPFMGKLVRCIDGELIDFALDIRVGSPSFGKMVAYELKSNPAMEYSEWIWVPPGFAHGTLLTVESKIEYFCTGTWSPETEFGISILSDDIDKSLCDPSCLNKLENTISSGDYNINERDLNYPSVTEWQNDSRSQNFLYGMM